MGTYIPVKVCFFLCFPFFVLTLNILQVVKCKIFCIFYSTFIKKWSPTSVSKNVSKEDFFLKNKYKMIVILDSFKFLSAVKKTVKFKMKKSDIQIF